MKAVDIRRSFLEFFRERGHRVYPSASLVPDDPTLLLTVAGMVPFKPYFEGTPIDNPRAASVQKCVRTSDIENVGVTARHQTLFEMLGNFSFGDYFKREAIEWAWELSIGPWGLDPDRIWVTVYESDDEAEAIWRDIVGLPEHRVLRRGPSLGHPKEDNFWWIAGARGPGGPNSELFYDRSPTPMSSFDDGDQLMEYYNLVFPQYEVGPDGDPVGDLPMKSVDTGSGLERVAQILQEVPTAYETDLFKPILDRAQDVTGRRYGAEQRADVSLRILSEHARSAMFLIGDGVLPSNEGRGYVLRRLVRRAVRHARLLGVDEPVMGPIVEAAIAVMGGWYQEVETGKAFITQVVAGEEDAFRATLGRGLTMLDTAIGEARAAGGRALGGDVSFKLHDTYGFPLELTVEIAQDAGLDVDRDAFEHLMDEQRERARAARRVEGRDENVVRELASAHGATTFIGYEVDADEAAVLAIVRDGERAERAREGDEVEIVLDRTPFYAEGGGQVGDRGTIETDAGRVEVADTQRRVGDVTVHLGRVVAGEIAAGVRARASVDQEHRRGTMRSHSATHILHATLRAALGEHARQHGSLVEPGRLRFDFSHFQTVPREQLERVEHEVNAYLLADDLVRPYETTMDEARSRGAIMLFEEKYGDIVRVVEIGDYSIELCGGTHVAHTSQVGAVKILGEASIGSNLRRVEALTGEEAIAGFRRSRAALEHIALLLRTSPDEAPARVERLLADLKTAEAEIRKARGAGERQRARELAEEAERIGETAVVVADVPGVGVQDLTRLAVAVRDALAGAAAVVLASADDGRAGIVAAVDRGTAARVKARDLIAQAAKAIGGGAGGKDDVATGGGKNAAGVDEALRLARAAARELLAG